MTSILSFARSHDTLAVGRPGSDPHGWRNALNYYGWGAAALTDASKRVYDDHAYTSFDAALKEAVTSIARFRMPVGVLARAGGHAQVATGYVVTGEDPATSDDFVVNGLYIVRPAAVRRHRQPLHHPATLLSGSLRYRFQTVPRGRQPARRPVHRRLSQELGRLVVLGVVPPLRPDRRRSATASRARPRRRRRRRPPTRRRPRTRRRRPRRRRARPPRARRPSRRSDRDARPDRDPGADRDARPDPGAEPVGGAEPDRRAVQRRAAGRALGVARGLTLAGPAESRATRPAARGGPRAPTPGRAPGRSRGG